MPPLSGFEYLLNLLFDIGPVMSGAMGSGPLTYTEISEAQRCLGIRLTPFECRTLRHLSITYLNESQAAVKRNAVAPWTQEVANGKPQPTALQLSLRALTEL